MKKNGVKNWPSSNQRAYSYPQYSKDPERSVPIIRWGFMVILALWMFGLGILVGRYTAPFYVKGRSIETELAQMKAAEIEENKEKIKEVTASIHHEDLEFYDKLRHNKQSKPLEKKPVRSSTPEVKRPQSTKNKVLTNSDGEKETGSTHDILNVFVIQVASFKDLKDAERLVKHLIEKGYDGAYYATETPIGSAVRHRVKVGYFPTRSSAMKTLRQLRRQERMEDAYIVRRN